jgi:hypothetical protein
MNRSETDTLVGVVLLVLGGLALFGWLNFDWVVTVAAVAAIIVGILILTNTIKGTQVMGLVLLAVGILLIVPNFLKEIVGSVVSTVLAVLLVLLGILKLMHKW